MCKKESNKVTENTVSNSIIFQPGGFVQVTHRRVRGSLVIRPWTDLDSGFFHSLQHSVDTDQ